MNIIGPGRIGTFLFQQAPPGTRLISREDDLATLSLEPTIITVRMSDLELVLSSLPPELLSGGHLIFVQNGIYEQWLKTESVNRYTQMLLYFSVLHLGACPRDGGESVVSGPLSHLCQSILTKGGIALSEVPPHEFRKLAYEKLIWASIFGLLCDFYRSSVSEITTLYKHEVTALARELELVCRLGADVELPLGLSDRLCRYSMTLADYRASVKEYPYRNGFFRTLGDTPLQDQYLQALGLLLQ